jgi:soluble lytic murein transglycosylase-like protein
LKKSVAEVYTDSAKFFYRLAQIYAESAFNPLATSDFGDWHKSGLDTVSALYQRKGAGGLAQFIWPTAKEYGARSITTSQAFTDTIAPDVYNPFWSIHACCQYMKSISILLSRTRNSKSRSRIVVDKEFQELCSTASYNTGPGKLLKLLNQTCRWQIIRLKILQEPRLYSEKIIIIAKEMKELRRWR